MIDFINLIDLCADRIEISGYSPFRSHSPELLSLHTYLYPQCLYLSVYHHLTVSCQTAIIHLSVPYLSSITYELSIIYVSSFDLSVYLYFPFDFENFLKEILLMSHYERNEIKIQEVRRCYKSLEGGTRAQKTDMENSCLNI